MTFWDTLVANKVNKNLLDFIAVRRQLPPCVLFLATHTACNCKCRVKASFACVRFVSVLSIVVVSSLHNYSVFVYVLGIEREEKISEVATDLEG